MSDSPDELLEFYVNKYYAELFPDIADSNVHQDALERLRAIIDCCKNSVERDPSAGPLNGSGESQSAGSTNNDETVQSLRKQLADHQTELDQVIVEKCQLQSLLEHQAENEAGLLSGKASERGKLEEELQSALAQLQTIRDHHRFLLLNNQQLSHEVTDVRKQLKEANGKIVQQQEQAEQLTILRRTLQEQRMRILQLENTLKCKDHALIKAQESIQHLNLLSSRLIKSLRVEDFKRELAGISGVVKDHCATVAFRKGSETAQMRLKAGLEQVENVRAKVENCEDKIYEIECKGNDNSRLQSEGVLLEASETLAAIEDRGNERIRYKKGKLLQHIQHLKRLLNR